MSPMPLNQENDGRGYAPDQPEQPVFLEGMKVLFDDKAGLYPVNLVTETPESPRHE